MGRVLIMFRGMAVGRAVATANVTTGETETKMHPGRPGLQAFFTTLRAGRHGLNSLHMGTGHESPPWLKGKEQDLVPPIIVILGQPRVYKSELGRRIINNCESNAGPGSMSHQTLRQEVFSDTRE